MATTAPTTVVGAPEGGAPRMLASTSTSYAPEDDDSDLRRRQRLIMKRANQSALDLLRQQKEEETEAEERKKASFNAVVRSAAMINSARRLGRTWVNKMYVSELTCEEQSFQRVLSDGISRRSIRDPKLLLQFEKDLAMGHIPYHEQGDHSFYVEGLVRKREAMAKDDLVQRCLTRLWDLVPKYGEDCKHIAMSDYINFHLCLQRVLFDPFDFAEALRRAEDDWMVDIVRKEGTYTIMSSLSRGDNAPSPIDVQFSDSDALAKRGMSEGK
jgi:hypothetical protein